MAPPPLPLPLNKTLDPADRVRLARAVSIVETIPDVLAGQHPQRWWEYAMAIEAFLQWREGAWGRSVDRRDLKMLDVGGAGSNFHRVLDSQTDLGIHLIDPALDSTQPWPDARTAPVPLTLQDYTTKFGVLLAGSIHVITCISTIEHVPAADVRPLLRAAATLLEPGGLLFLTMDYWAAEGPDTAHYHWMRERIYNLREIRLLQKMAREEGFAVCGRSDWTYHGPQVFDYTFAALALERQTPIG